MAKPKGRIMLASEVRTGDRLVSLCGGRARTITQVTKTGGDLVLNHGSIAYTRTPSTARVRVIRSSRTVNLDAPELAWTTSTTARAA